MPRLARERKTIRAMIAIWCEEKHGNNEQLCDDCQDILDYAMIRLDHCPFGESKSTCANCRIHCYSSEYRVMIKEVMRFSGPRMIFKHTLLAMAHFVDGVSQNPRH